MSWFFRRFTAGLIFAGMIVTVVWATGITVISYKDEYGRIFVTDSMDKVPAKYRASAEKHEISRIDSVEPVALPQVAPVLEAPSEEPTKPYRFDASPEAPTERLMVQVVQPPPVPDSLVEENLEDPSIATAAIILSLSNSIFGNLEKILFIARHTNGPAPQMAYHHFLNIKAFEELVGYDNFQWPEFPEWPRLARNLKTAFGYMIHAITNWLNSGQTPPNFIQDLFRHTASTKAILDQLAAMLQTRR